ncbi:MAG: 50S ribosomal protein L31 [Candidatus Moranbacteria bacterium]|nr:50S ribosomal protein L31 [Candidatus Moranbacteria bacterium]
MKKDIHPKYGQCLITCACGNKVKTRATVEEMKIEVCSACHPFYTGKKKILDSTGRVDRFMKRFSKTKKLKNRQKQGKKTKKTSSPKPQTSKKQKLAAKK